MDFLVDHSDHENLQLLRYMVQESKGTPGCIYLFPINLQRLNGISLRTIRAVLDELREKEHIEVITWPDHKMSEAKRIRSDDEGDYYYVELFDSFFSFTESIMTAADFFATERYKPNIAANENDQLTARLSFESISIPTVTVGDNMYSFRSMRSGRALNIISYCLDTIPNQMISIDNLKQELRAKQIPALGITNLRDDIRRSVFGDKKPLSVFVRVSPQGILVRDEIHITSEQLSALIKDIDK